MPLWVHSSSSRRVSELQYIQHMVFTKSISSTRAWLFFVKSQVFHKNSSIHYPHEHALSEWMFNCQRVTTPWAMQMFLNMNRSQEGSFLLWNHSSRKPSLSTESVRNMDFARGRAWSLHSIRTLRWASIFTHIHQFQIVQTRPLQCCLARQI